MRIAFLNVISALGGAERLLLDVLASLGQAAPDVDRHLILTEEGPLLDQARDLGVTTHLLPMPASITRLGDSSAEGRRLLGLLAAAPGVWIYARRLRQTLCRLAPDVVHSNSLKFHLLLRLARVRGPSIVWHLHDFVGARPLVGRTLRWVSGRTAGAIAISQAVAADAASILPRLPVEVVPNAIDTERFTPGPAADLDALAGLPPADVPRVGLIATYATWKGHDVFLEAAQRLASSVSARFYVIGGPIYRTAGSQWTLDQLRELSGELVEQRRVGFIGFQADTVPIYRALDVVVHASKKPEPFGLTIVEAMACGRPVVVSSGGGAAELFHHDVDALGFTPGNSRELAEMLRLLLNDPALRERLSTQARTSAVERYSKHRLAGQLLAAYQRFSHKH